MIDRDDPATDLALAAIDLGPGDRPGIGDRPIIGGNRPGWGGGNIGSGNIGSGNINIGSGNTVINNRPGWGNNVWRRATWWGLGISSRRRTLEQLLVRSPRASITTTAGTTVGGAATGVRVVLAVCLRRHGVGTRRDVCRRGVTTTAPVTPTANPYYVASATPAYDYSQPIVINTYNTPTSDASADASPEQTTTATQESPQETEGYQVVRRGTRGVHQG